MTKKDVATYTNLVPNRPNWELRDVLKYGKFSGRDTDDFNHGSFSPKRCSYWEFVKKTIAQLTKSLRTQNPKRASWLSKQKSKVDAVWEGETPSTTPRHNRIRNEENREEKYRKSRESLEVAPEDYLDFHKDRNANQLEMWAGERAPNCRESAKSSFGYPPWLRQPLEWLLDLFRLSTLNYSYVRTRIAKQSTNSERSAISVEEPSGTSLTSLFRLLQSHGLEAWKLGLEAISFVHTPIQRLIFDEIHTAHRFSDGPTKSGLLMNFFLLL